MTSIEQYIPILLTAAIIIALLVVGALSGHITPNSELVSDRIGEPQELIPLSTAGLYQPKGVVIRPIGDSIEIFWTLNETEITGLKCIGIDVYRHVDIDLLGEVNEIRPEEPSCGLNYYRDPAFAGRHTLYQMRVVTPNGPGAWSSPYIHPFMIGQDNAVYLVGANDQHSFLPEQALYVRKYRDVVDLYRARIEIPACNDDTDVQWAVWMPHDGIPTAAAANKTTWNKFALLDSRKRPDDSAFSGNMVFEGSTVIRGRTFSFMKLEFTDELPYQQCSVLAGRWIHFSYVP